MRDLLRGRAADGGTIFVSSHLLAEVELLADDVIVLNRGRLVTNGPLRDLLQGAFLVRSSDPHRLAPLLEEAGATVQPRDGEAIVVRGLSMDDIGELALRAGIALHELTPDAGSLEELFLGWTESDDSQLDTTHEKRVAAKT